jgi:hypothetical protein
MCSESKAYGNRRSLHLVDQPVRRSPRTIVDAMAPPHQPASQPLLEVRGPNFSFPVESRISQVVTYHRLVRAPSLLPIGHRPLATNRYS